MKQTKFNRATPEKIEALIRFYATKPFGHRSTIAEVLNLFGIPCNFTTVFTGSKVFKNLGTWKSPNYTLSADWKNADFADVAARLHEDYKNQLTERQVRRDLKAVKAEEAAPATEAPAAEAPALVFREMPTPAEVLTKKPGKKIAWTQPQDQQDLFPKPAGLKDYQAEAILEMLIEINQKLDLLLTVKKTA